MPSFRTDFPVSRAHFSIGHSDRLLLIGSCFTEHIGARLLAGKIPAVLNPFGIVYNPQSIVQSLERLWAGDQYFTESDLFEQQGLWHSWEHHGHFSQPDRQQMLDDLNGAYTRAASALRQSTVLLLTLGTADVFQLRATGQVVANNHKMPAALFDARRLGVMEIAAGFCTILQKIKTELPGLQIILTVSPVRHLRTGPVENQRSKATLVLACAEIGARFPTLHYFPAYELLLDDLRDYRFYAPDLVHPSEPAVDYIWEHFAGTFFSTETRGLLAQLAKIEAAVRHRAFHPGTAQHRAFALAQLAAIATLSDAQPGLDFTREVEHFQRFL